MEVLSLIIYTKYFWDFGIWSFNRVWPLNGGPLNGGSTVVIKIPPHGAKYMFILCVLASAFY